MKALVIYDSVFGNTEKVARAIGKALGAEALPVSAAGIEQLQGLDLLVIGSPTRGFRPTEGISTLVSSLDADAVHGIHTAAFDTRIVLDTIKSRPLRFLVDKGGYAADRIGRMLEKKGGLTAAAPEGFLVTGEQGPLKEGELERAAEWGRKLLERV